MKTMKIQVMISQQKLLSCSWLLRCCGVSGGDPNGHVVAHMPGHAAHQAAGPSAGDVQSLLHLVLGGSQMWVQDRSHCITLVFDKMIIDPFQFGMQVSFTGSAWSLGRTR